MNAMFFFSNRRHSLHRTLQLQLSAIVLTFVH